MNEHKYMWNHAGTSLLISIWSDNLIQKQLRATLRNQSIWDYVSRCLVKKGFQVNGKQCRTRIKNILVRYREAKKNGNICGSGIEAFYDDIDKVMAHRNSNKIQQNAYCVVGVVNSNSAIRTLPYAKAIPMQIAKSVEGKGSVDHSSNNRSVKGSTDILHINIKQEDNSITLSENSEIQELDDLSHDSIHHPGFYEAVDDELLSTQIRSVTRNSSPAASYQTLNNGNIHHMTNTEGSRESQEFEDYLPTVEEQASLQHGGHKESFYLERLVKCAIQAQGEAITKVIHAQSELFQKMLEADRERQIRMEARLDKILDRLDQLSPSTPLPTLNSSTCNLRSEREQSTKLNKLLERLEWALPFLSPTSSNVSTKVAPNNEAKLDSLLDKLNKIIPVKQSSID